MLNEEIFILFFYKCVIRNYIFKDVKLYGVCIYRYDFIM